MSIQCIDSHPLKKKKRKFSSAANCFNDEVLLTENRYFSSYQRSRLGPHFLAIFGFGLQMTLNFIGIRW